LADPNYDIADIAKPYLVSGGLVGGEKGYLEGPNAVLYGVPFGAETSLLAYRKDIFEDYNIDVPKNYDQLKDAILKLSALGVPAMTSRDDWEPVVNSQQAVEAAEFLRLVTQTGPKGISDFNFGHSAFAFLSGGAAMYLDNFKIASASRDPSFSHFKDLIGYTSHPVGSRCSAETGGFAIGIPSNSKNQEAGGDPVRLSTFIKNQSGRPESSAVIGSILCADTNWRPLIPEWSRIQNEVLGPALLEVTRTTRPVQEIMDAANAELRILMDEAGY